ncbi:MAG: DUF1573 domain-containing protein [Pirellulales bacterium]|nr:DUF1573 domain-containing protein [Pirellulales bacterium]
MRRFLLLACLSALLGAAVGGASALPTFGILRGVSDPTRPQPAPVNDARAPALIPEGKPQPKAVVDEPLYDFGAADTNTKGVHVFNIRNTGEGPLVLTQGDTTCKCTISKLGTEPVPPGGTAEVTLEWTVRTAFGESFRQEAVVFTNDRQSPRLVLVVQGRISETIVAVPNHLDFGRMLRTEEKTAVVHVYSQFAGPFEIKQFSLTNPSIAAYFEVKLRPLAREEFRLDTAHSGYELLAHLKPGLPLGQIEQRILLTTNLEQAPEFELPVLGYLDSDFNILGKGWNRLTQVVDLGSLAPGEGATRQLSLKVAGPLRDTIKFQTPQVDLAGVTGQLGEPSRTEHAVLYPLTITIANQLPPQTHLGTATAPYGILVLESNHPEIPRYEIKLKFVVRER